MIQRPTLRRLLISVLALTIAAWAEAGLALVEGDQVMRCSMSGHKMQARGETKCCPMSDEGATALSPERPPCCSVSNAAERPVNFVVSEKQVKSQQLDAAPVPAAITVEVGNYVGAWRSADAPRFVRPVPELKTDLRI